METGSRLLAGVAMPFVPHGGKLGLYQGLVC